MDIQYCICDTYITIFLGGKLNHGLMDGELCLHAVQRVELVPLGVEGCQPHGDCLVGRLQKRYKITSYIKGLG